MTVKKRAAKHAPFQSNTVAGASFTIGAEAGNVINVIVQLEDGNGNALAERGCVTMYASDDAAGDSISAAPDTIAIGTDGVSSQAYAASEALIAVSEADGDIDINITEAGGADTFYLIVVLPDGTLVASSAITFA